jgi:cyclopropane fatty-acyl-phospholipid synthase-like methyltransferase
MVNILIPGRHHALTDFQSKYLHRLIETQLQSAKDINGKPLLQEPVEDIIFAVTSANHSNTRRNPLPLHLRSMAIERFATEFHPDTYIYPINDVGTIDDFASYVIKSIEHQSEGKHNLSPENTKVICSTPVLDMYETLGFTILPAELTNREHWVTQETLPWQIVEEVAKDPTSVKREWYLDHAHKATQQVWKKYDVPSKIQVLFSDLMIGDDGDLTETRDYNTYVRQMDEIAQLKYDDTKQHIIPGRIGDIGCAVGSWIKLAAQDFNESDFYGIEVSRELFDRCEDRKKHNEFEHPYVFFAKKNAVTQNVFPKHSMNTIHTSSLTHEIESYSGREDLLSFITNRYDELVPGGAWINRDVVGPENKHEEVYLWLDATNGSNEEEIHTQFDNREELAEHLQGLSTLSKFYRFAQDYHQEVNFNKEMVQRGEAKGKELIKTTLSTAMEFLLKKDYIDNWDSEMHEKFTFWSFNDWKENLERVGFSIDENSQAFTNDWIVENRIKGQAQLYNANLEPMDIPVTNMITVAKKL